MAVGDYFQWIRGTLRTAFKIGKADFDSSGLTAPRTLTIPNASGALVLGPTSAVNNGVALFDDTTGKLIKDGGVLGTAASLPIDTDGTLAANSDAKIPTQKAVKTYVDTAVTGLSIGGWLASSGTWTYASADSPTFTLTVNADVTSFIGVGNKIKLTQTTVKYFIVTAISYSSPNTTITIYGGTDYTLANAAISSPYYSYQKSPVGFPMSPAKWTVKVTDANDKQIATPTTNTWYGGANAFTTGANITISVPIGVWRIGWSAYQYVLDTSATITTMEATLSSSNNSESDEELTASIGGNGASSTMTVRQTTRAETIVTLAAKTTYYLLLRTETAGMTDLNLAGTNRASIITAECAYL